MLPKVRDFTRRSLLRRFQGCALVRAAVRSLALKRDPHRRASRRTHIDTVQQLGNKHGCAPFQGAHFLQIAATTIIRSVPGESVRTVPSRQSVECHEKVIFSLPVEDLRFGGCVASSRAKMKPQPMGHGFTERRKGEGEQEEFRHCQKLKTKDINSKKKRPICQTVSAAALIATDSRNSPSGKRHSRHGRVRATSGPGRAAGGHVDGGLPAAMAARGAEGVPETAPSQLLLFHQRSGPSGRARAADSAPL